MQIQYFNAYYDDKFQGLCNLDTCSSCSVSKWGMFTVKISDVS